MNSRRWRFVFAYETARDATRHSLHIHGGYGFGMEQDIQLYYRRARGWAMVYGEPAAVLDRVADMRYGAVAMTDCAPQRGVSTAKLNVARAASRSRPTSIDIDSHDDYSACLRGRGWRWPARVR